MSTNRNTDWHCLKIKKDGCSLRALAVKTSPGAGALPFISFGCTSNTEFLFHYIYLSEKRAIHHSRL